MASKTKTTKEEKSEKKARIESVKNKAYESALEEINKKFKGEDRIVGMLDNFRTANVEYIDTGSFTLNSILGGGFAKGRVIELSGPESSGKTSIALNAIASVQREGGTAVFIDAEQALDPNYARILGVDTRNLGFSQESLAERTIKLIEQLVESGNVDIIVVDSVASLIPEAEFEDSTKTTVAVLPRLLSKALRKLIRLLKDTKTTIIFLNQIRDNVGSFYGPATTTPGGRALKFFASQRVEIKRDSVIKEKDKALGTVVKMKVVKNKVAPPFLEGKTVLSFAQGINKAAELYEVGVDKGVITKTGNTHWFTPLNKVNNLGLATLEDDGVIKLGIGKEKVINTIRSSDELLKEIANVLVQTLEHERTQHAIIAIEQEEDYEDYDDENFNEEELFNEIDD